MATEPTTHSKPFHLSGNYAPVADELTRIDLPVTGAIPPVSDMAKAPLAAIHTPRRVPHGFHGSWIRE
jgi:carotenoid cleavage dioxygenase-like enzyme